MSQPFDSAERYSRNLPAITADEQRVLARKTVCVCGCGGIGGYVIELLARLGVGRIVAIDPDILEASNLNRQLLSHEGNLGQAKARAAQQRIAEINSEVDLIAICDSISEKNAAELLEGCDIAIDALDSAQTRMDLERWCSQAQIPLVHGAIAGWNAQVATIAPGSSALAKIYPPQTGGPEGCQPPSALAFTAAFTAALEAAECTKVLLGKDTALYGRLRLVDLLHNTQRIIEL